MQQPPQQQQQQPRLYGQPQPPGQPPPQQPVRRRRRGLISTMISVYWMMKWVILAWIVVFVGVAFAASVSEGGGLVDGIVNSAVWWAAPALVVPIVFAFIYLIFNIQKARLAVGIGAIVFAGSAVFTIPITLDEVQQGAIGGRWKSEGYADQSVELCAGTATADSFVAAGNADIFAMVDPANGELRGAHFDMGDSVRGDELTDVGILLCVLEKEEVIETCEYTNGGERTRIQHEWSITAIDTSNGQTLANRTFSGTVPSNCPSSIESSGDSNINGSDPDINTIVTWADEQR